ncbi:MAG: glycine oxidase ThiO, partial [Gammaproteobacteria bacterium]
QSRIADCIVVGGGVIGLLTAYELAQEGLRVTVVERGHRIAGAASWASGGVLAPLYPWRICPAVLPLLNWSHARYRQLALELTACSGVDPEWVQSGLLILEPALWPELATTESPFTSDAQLLNQRGLKSREPGVGAGENGALWFPQVAQIRSPRLLRALELSLAHKGVKQLSAPVQGILSDKRKAAGVVTRDGRIYAPIVVVAAGAWSGLVLGSLGKGFELRPIRGQMLLIAVKPGLLRHVLVQRDHYLIPRRDGQVLVGSTLENTGFNNAITAEARETLTASAWSMYPRIRNYPIVTHWSGLRPGSPQGIPWIGAHPERTGLYLSTGHYRNGISLAPASARLLADLILQRPPIVEPSAYDPARASQDNGQRAHAGSSTRTYLSTASHYRALR